jgi:hypothetical protein
MVPLSSRCLFVLLLAMMAIFAPGCIYRSHSAVDIVDSKGYHHQGYYDNDNTWRGGYYDESHVWHDDPRNWHP